MYHALFGYSRYMCIEAIFGEKTSMLAVYACVWTGMINTFSVCHFIHKYFNIERSWNSAISIAISKNVLGMVQCNWYYFGLQFSNFPNFSWPTRRRHTIHIFLMICSQECIYMSGYLYLFNKSLWILLYHILESKKRL